MLPSIVPIVPTSYRACEVCDHGRKLPGLCVCPALAHERDKRIEALRAFGGACGPDAKFLEFPGLRARRHAA